MSSKRELLYILAPSYSGSTLLTYLLAQHPEIATVGELKATQMGPVDRYRCSCNELIEECEFWSALVQEAHIRELPFSLQRFDTVFCGTNSFSKKVVRAGVRSQAFEMLRKVVISAIPGLPHAIEQTAARNYQLGEIICELQNGSILLDGSKDPVRLHHLMESGNWRVKVICLTRDGRGVSASTQSHVRIPYVQAVKEWNRTARELQRMRNRLSSEQVFDLRYEELCAEPAVWMSKLWKWLGLADISINEIGFKDGQYHILGNMMRLNSVSSIRLDEKWKKNLSSDEFRIFQKHAGRLNRSLGYD